jgi:hypothetical protein
MQNLTPAFKFSACGEVDAAMARVQRSNNTPSYAKSDNA